MRLQSFSLSQKNNIIKWALPVFYIGVVIATVRVTNEMYILMLMLSGHAQSKRFIVTGK